MGAGKRKVVNDFSFSLHVGSSSWDLRLSYEREMRNLLSQKVSSKTRPSVTSIHVRRGPQATSVVLPSFNLFFLELGRAASDTSRLLHDPRDYQGRSAPTEAVRRTERVRELEGGRLAVSSISRSVGLDLSSSFGAPKMGDSKNKRANISSSPHPLVTKPP